MISSLQDLPNQLYVLQQRSKKGKLEVRSSGKLEFGRIFIVSSDDPVSDRSLKVPVTAVSSLSLEIIIYIKFWLT